jgi:hypothetical protein
LIVALPLLGIYGFRAALPDHSFDVLSYHLLHGERSIRGPLFRPGDFFPSAAPFNPAPDMLTAISRLVLGYRLGTVINLLALIWTAQVTDRIMRRFVESSLLRAVCVLIVLLAEHLLFEVNTYMVDLLTLPLMLEATYLTLRAEESDAKLSSIFHIAFLLGASVAFKVTNLAVALPLFLVWGITTWKRSTRVAQFSEAAFLSDKLQPAAPTTNSSLSDIKSAAAAMIIFLLPILPFTIYLYRLTGNPLFPIGNVYFKSPYWPTHGGWDDRWGPVGILQTIFWPLLAVFHPERHSELSVYSGRLLTAVIAAVVGLILAWKNTYARKLCLVFLASSLLWSVAALGYGRYGLFDEASAGLIVVIVVALLLKRSARFPWPRIAAAAFALVLLGQTVVGINYVLHNDWGQRFTVFDYPKTYLREIKFFLRDRSLPQFLPPEQRDFFGAVPVWIESSVKSTGIEVFLNRKSPIISINHPEYFFTRESRRQFVTTVDQLSNPVMYSLVLSDELENAKQSAALRGLEVGRVTPIEIPFFSKQDRIGMMLLEIRRPEEVEARARFASSWMNAAFPDADYRAEITALNAPTTMRSGEKQVIKFRVKNLGYSTWPAVGNKEGRFQVNIGNRWLRPGTAINGLDGRTGMPDDLPPNGEVQLELTVTAPVEPGDYILEIDMVHEGVTWFYERGARPLHLPVRVER